MREWSWNRVMGKVVRQYNLGSWLGALKDLFGRTAFYISIGNFVLIAVTAYHTTLRDPILGWLPWFTFPLFMGVVVMLVLLAMILEYKFVVPSSITFINRQVYEHRSLLRRDLEQITERLTEMEKVNATKQDLERILARLTEKEKVNVTKGD